MAQSRATQGVETHMVPLVTWSARKPLSPLLTLVLGAAAGLVIGFILGGTCG